MSRGAGKSQRLREGNPRDAQVAAFERERLWEMTLRSSGQGRDDLLAQAVLCTALFYEESRGLKTRTGSLSVRAAMFVETAVTNLETRWQHE